MAALIVGFRARQGIDSVIFRVPAVTLYPVPFDLVRRRGFE